jgi:hypothetical protein
MRRIERQLPDDSGRCAGKFDDANAVVVSEFPRAPRSLIRNG